MPEDVLTVTSTSTSKRIKVTKAFLKLESNKYLKGHWFEVSRIKIELLTCCTKITIELLSNRLCVQKVD